MSPKSATKTSLISGSMTRSPYRRKNGGASFGSARMSASETTTKTGNQTFGLMKIADSATAVQRSVTNVALMSSFPTFVVLSPRSTSTEYTTARDVVESAVPAISDALRVQSRTKYATGPATTNGPANDETPMPIVAFARSRMYVGSTSMPARNVRTIEANFAMKSSQSAVWRWNTLPTTTPSVSSIRATVMPSSTESIDATSTTAARTAASWTGLMTTSYFASSQTFGRGHQPRRAIGREPHRARRQL